MRMRPLRKDSRSLPCKPACVFVCVAALLAGAGAMAQPRINSSPNPVGSGARALGMGGAFIAIADDATAASWNPGGLTQLERPEISAVYAWKSFREDYDAGARLELDRAGEVDFSSLNYLSVVYPFQRTIAGRNVVISLNYQRKFDFDRAMDLTYHDMDAATQFSTQGRLHYEQSGSLAALSPALAFEVTDQLSLGMAVNIWDESLLGQNEWSEYTRADTWTKVGGTLLASRFEQLKRYENFDGMNYTFGVLYKPAERWSIGAVYHTAFAADVDYTEVQRQPRVQVNKEKRRIEMPSAWGLGVAYRFPNDKLTLSLDVTRRQWDQYVEVQRGLFGQAQRISPITGLEKWRSPHDSTYTVRLGAEYVFFDPKQPLKNYLPSLRAGVFYDPAPAGGGHFLANINGQEFYSRMTGKPDDFWGISLGAGVLIRNRINIDIAYQYRWGDDVRKDTFQQWDMDGDVDQHEIFLSTVIYF